MSEPTADQIARNVLGIETLATRNSDSLDFHELAVWQIREALDAAAAAAAAERAELLEALKDCVRHMQGLTADQCKAEERALALIAGIEPHKST